MAYCFDFSSGTGMVSIGSMMDALIAFTGGGFVGAWVKIPPTVPDSVAILSATYFGATLTLFDGNQLTVNFLNTQTGAMMNCCSKDLTSIADGTWHFVGFGFDVNMTYCSFVKDGVVTDTEQVIPYPGAGGSGWPGLTMAYYNANPNSDLIVFGNLEDCNSASFPGQVGYFYSTVFQCDPQNVANALPAGVESESLQYWNSVAMQTQIANDGCIDVMCPLLGCLGSAQLSSVKFSTATIVPSSADLLIYSNDTYWDGYTEIWLSAPSAPFPVFTTNQMAAFSYMMQVLGMTGETLTTFRAMYSNQVQDLSAYAITLGAIQFGQITDPTFSEADFLLVQAQMCMELNAASGLQNYYKAVLGTYTLTYLDNLAQATYVGAGLNQDEVTIPSGSSISGDLTDAVTGIAGAMTVAGYGAVGNGLKALWAVLNTQLQAQIPPDLYGPFTAAYESLLETVQTNWTTAINCLSEQVTALVQDNGKLSATYQLVLGNYLQWNFSENEVPSAVSQANQAFYAETLMTSVYDMVCFTCQNSNNAPSGPCCPCPGYDDRFTLTSGGGFLIVGDYDEEAATITAVPQSGAADFLFNTMALTNGEVMLDWSWPEADESCPMC